MTRLTLFDLRGRVRSLLAWKRGWWAERTLRGAAAQGDLARTHRLLALGTDANACSLRRRMSALSAAALGGCREVVHTLVAAGATVDTRTRDGATPLIIAAQGGHEGVVELLLAAGAYPDAALPRTGSTALVIASIAGHAGVVRALLRAGADPLARTRETGTALTYATEPAVIRLLQQAIALPSTAATVPGPWACRAARCHPTAQEVSHAPIGPGPCHDAPRTS
jgi:ankyrin repeat protein